MNRTELINRKKSASSRTEEGSDWRRPLEAPASEVRIALPMRLKDGVLKLSGGLKLRRGRCFEGRGEP